MTVMQARDHQNSDKCINSFDLRRREMDHDTIAIRMETKRDKLKRISVFVFIASILDVRFAIKDLNLI
jgi:hypothetical protein